jgi:hypothetical protein
MMIVGRHDWVSVATEQARVLRDMPFCIGLPKAKKLCSGGFDWIVSFKC